VRPVQRFSDDYLREARRISPAETLRFLEDFRLLHGARTRSRLISLKVPEPLLRAFRLRCSMRGVRYQSQIKSLMADWLGRVEGRREP
jgi:predicted DNA binding CopG/RHH family protein